MYPPLKRKRVETPIMDRKRDELRQAETMLKRKLTRREIVGGATRRRHPVENDAEREASDGAALSFAQLLLYVNAFFGDSVRWFQRQVRETLAARRAGRSFRRALREAFADPWERYVHQQMQLRYGEGLW